MTKHGIDLYSPAVQEYCRKWKITELSVFGSILRQDFRPDSDIDVIVDFEEDAIWDLSDLGFMRRELATILGHRVDILTRGALNETENWLFKKSVLEELETVRAAR